MPADHDDPFFDDLVDCDVCGAANPPGGVLCVQCKAPLEDRESRLTRRRAVTRARNALLGVRGLYWVYAAGLVVAAVVRGAKGAPSLTWELAVLGVVAGFGAAFLYRFPVVITFGMAIMHTAWSVLMARSGGAEFVADTIKMAVALWLAVPIVMQARRYADRDEYAANRLRGFVSDADRSQARGRAAARRLDERRAALRIWVPIAVGLAGVAAVGFAGYRIVTRPAPIPPPPPIDGALSSWELALRNGNLAAAEALCTEEYRERWPRVVRILEREEWANGVAIRPAFEHRAGANFKEIHFDLPRGKMKTIWIVEDGAWRANRVVMSRVRAKSAE